VSAWWRYASLSDMDSSDDEPIPTDVLLLPTRSALAILPPPLFPNHASDNVFQEHCAAKTAQNA